MRGLQWKTQRQAQADKPAFGICAVCWRRFAARARAMLPAGMHPKGSSGKAELEPLISAVPARRASSRSCCPLPLPWRGRRAGTAACSSATSACQVSWRSKRAPLNTDLPAGRLPGLRHAPVLWRSAVAQRAERAVHLSILPTKLQLAATLRRKATASAFCALGTHARVPTNCGTHLWRHASAPRQ